MVKIPLSLLLILYNAMNYRLVEKKVPLSLSCCIEKGFEIFFAFEIEKPILFVILHSSFVNSSAIISACLSTVSVASICISGG